MPVDLEQLRQAIGLAAAISYTHRGAGGGGGGVRGGNVKDRGVGKSHCRRAYRMLLLPVIYKQHQPLPKLHIRISHKPSRINCKTLVNTN